MSSESLQTQAFKKGRFVDDFRTALTRPEELVSKVCSLMASLQCQLSDEDPNADFSFARGKSHAPLFNVLASDCSAQIFLWMNSDQTTDQSVDKKQEKPNFFEVGHKL